MVLIIGILGGILTAVRLVPQVYRSHRYKTTCSISWAFIYMLIAQSLLMLAYGYLKPDIIIFLMNIPPLICSLWLAKLKALYK